MPRIIKTTFGDAQVAVEEEFINEEAAQEGLHPEATKAKVFAFKTERITFKLKDLMKND